MAFDIPTQAEIINRIKSSVRKSTGTNPFTPNNFVGAICIALGGSVFDCYLQLLSVIDLAMPDTADSAAGSATQAEFAQRWGNLKKIFPLAATGSSGLIAIEGSAPASVPVNTIFNSSDGSVYLTQAVAPVLFTTASILSITRIGQVATVTTATNHNLGTGITVTVAGASQPEYNITTQITVLNAMQFEYVVSGSPATPATGTISYSGYFGSVVIQSTDFGADTALEPGEQVTLQEPIDGVSDNAYAGFEGVIGGRDDEEIETYRARYIDAFQNPGPYFSVPEINRRMKTIAGTTRTFIYPITPNPGQATIYFMRDNDENPIPDGTKVNEMKALITDVNYFNISMNPANLFVYAPTPVIVNFIFASITPNTPTMKQAIIQNIKAFFATETTLVDNIKAEAYTCAIYNTVDSVTGETLKDFILSSPIGDIGIGGNVNNGTAGMGLVGTVTFA